MATTQRGLVFVAFLFTIIAAVFNTVSLGTEMWISGRVVGVSDSTLINYVNFGLFQGNYKRYYPSNSIFAVTMTCDFGLNACALLCGLDSTERSELLKNLFNGIIDHDYSMNNCAAVTSSAAIYRANSETNFIRSSDVATSKNFMNAGLWLTTVIFLILAILTGYGTAVMTFYNIIANPINYFLGVKSQIIYNGLAFFCTVMGLVLWGTAYITTIFHDVGLYDTIEGTLTSDKQVYLGYSYWINFIPLMFYAASIATILYREQVIQRDPTRRVALEVDQADPNLYLY